MVSDSIIDERTLPSGVTSSIIVLITLVLLVSWAFRRLVPATGPGSLEPSASGLASTGTSAAVATTGTAAVTTAAGTSAAVAATGAASVATAAGASTTVASASAAAAGTSAAVAAAVASATGASAAVAAAVAAAATSAAAVGSASGTKQSVKGQMRSLVTWKRQVALQCNIKKV